MRNWEDLRAKLDLDDNKNFYLIQTVHTSLSSWKETFFECGNNVSNLIISKHKKTSHVLFRKTK